MKSNNLPQTKTILLLSDSTGNLGEYFIRALVSQFPKSTFRIEVFSFIDNKKELERALKNLPSDPVAVFHTVLSIEMKKAIEKAASEKKWPSYDLTDGAMKFLEQTSQIKSGVNPEALHELNQEYDNRIAAINFTVEHDDGLSGPTLKKADIVLLGVSRTSKTPTSVYLANKGYKVANIPIVMGSFLHEEIKKYPRLKVVGLTIDPEKLKNIRVQRAQQDKNPSRTYTDLDQIKEELRIAQIFFLEIGCPVVDVTNRAVEETAALILKALDLR